MIKRRVKIWMQRSARMLKKCEEGFSSVEFAFLLPVMLLIFFGLIEATDALSANRRVSRATNTIADLVAQSAQLTPAELDGLMVGAGNVLAPSDGSISGLRVVSIELQGTTPVVHWSYDDQGLEPYSRGAQYTKLNDMTLLQPGSTLIVSEVHYTHNSSFFNQVMPQSFTFDRTAVRLPRLVSRVEYCPSSGNCF